MTGSRSNATLSPHDLLNRHKLAASNDELERLTLGVADGSISKREAMTLFQVHVKTPD